MGVFVVCSVHALEVRPTQYPCGYGFSPGTSSRTEHGHVVVPGTSISLPNPKRPKVSISTMCNLSTRTPVTYQPSLYTPQGEGGFLACRHQFSKDVLWERVRVRGESPQATPSSPVWHSYALVSPGWRIWKSQYPLSPTLSPGRGSNSGAPVRIYASDRKSPHAPYLNTGDSSERGDCLLPAWDVRGSLAA